MPDILESGIGWLESQRDKHRTKPVTFCRGAESIEVQATVAKWTFEIDDGMGILEKIESRDFLILISHLVLAGQAIEPQRGDRIKETSGNKVYVYEVLAPGKEDCWIFSDDYRNTYRIHTKQVDVEDAT